jgi:hypothetical protein
VAGASPPTPAAPAPAPTEAAPVPVHPSPAPDTADAAPAVAAPASADDSGLPTRDELTLAWGDSILASLPPRAKAFYAAGRFLEVSGKAAVFGLPNAPHMQRCESGRADVEAALARHFGRAVPLRLAVDDDSPPPAAPSGGPAASADPSAPPPVPEDHEIDPSELVDATDVAATSVDRVKELFPGAELVDPS